MDNENCLHHRACPECGNEQKLQVQGLLWLDVYDDGTIPTEDKMRGDHEYGPDAVARCPECGFEGRWCQFFAIRL